MQAILPAIGGGGSFSAYSSRPVLRGARPTPPRSHVAILKLILQHSHFDWDRRNGWGSTALGVAAITRSVNAVGLLDAARNGSSKNVDAEVEFLVSTWPYSDLNTRRIEQDLKFSRAVLRYEQSFPTRQE